MFGIFTPVGFWRQTESACHADEFSVTYTATREIVDETGSYDEIGDNWEKSLSTMLGSSEADFHEHSGGGEITACAAYTGIVVEGEVCGSVNYQFTTGIETTNSKEETNEESHGYYKSFAEITSQALSYCKHFSFVKKNLGDFSAENSARTLVLFVRLVYSPRQNLLKCVHFEGKITKNENFRFPIFGAILHLYYVSGSLN